MLPQGRFLSCKEPDLWSGRIICCAESGGAGKSRSADFFSGVQRRILREAEACKEPGQLGALLRREGLYSSNLTTWRRQAEEGTLDALSPKKRGPIKRLPDSSLRRIAELEKENRKLNHKLKQAELIIEAQKKITQILQTPLDPDGETNS